MLIINLFKSKYCIAIFILSLILSYLILPYTAFQGYFLFITIIFMIVFSLLITCTARNIKERIMLAKTYKTSLISMIAIIIGISALQVCGIGSVCGMTIGLSILSIIFPGIFLNILSQYYLYFILFSIALQLGMLYYLNCFKRENNLNTKTLIVINENHRNRHRRNKN